ncbi:MAG TPA: hypothetical protein VM939_07750, partial [Gemmatimonadaceae bacterium]|nr:hypothetical protein [Gemmatimonadaceae bacterium]
MSRAALLLALPVMLACSKEEAPPADTAIAAAPEATVAPTPVNYAGTWKVNVMPEDKDTLLLSYTMQGTGERTGWVLNLPNREPMQGRVLHLDNDSVVVENGPYSSVLRKDMMVSTRSTMRVEGDRLTGKTIATYKTKAGDSLV